MPQVRVAMTPVYVSNQDRALDFFVQKLGFQNLMDDRFGEDFRWLTVTPPGGEASLILASGYGAPDADTRVGTFTGIVLTTDEIEAVHAAWAANVSSSPSRPRCSPGAWCRHSSRIRTATCSSSPRCPRWTEPPRPDKKEAGTCVPAPRWCLSRRP